MPELSKNLVGRQFMSAVDDKLRAGLSMEDTVTALLKDPKYVGEALRILTTYVRAMQDNTASAHVIGHQEAKISYNFGQMGRPQTKSLEVVGRDVASLSTPERKILRNYLKTTAFPLASGEFVEWGEATKEQHAERAKWLRDRAATMTHSAEVHDMAIQLITDGQVQCLNEIRTCDWRKRLYANDTDKSAGENLTDA